MIQLELRGVTEPQRLRQAFNWLYEVLECEEAKPLKRHYRHVSSAATAQGFAAMESTAHM